MIITANSGWYGFPLEFFQLSSLSVFLKYSIFQANVSRCSVCTIKQSRTLVPRVLPFQKSVNLLILFHFIFKFREIDSTGHIY